MGPAPLVSNSRDDIEDDTGATHIIPVKTGRRSDGAAYLIVVAGKSMLGKAYKIDPQLTLGRGDGCDLSLPGAGVSRLHASVVRHPEGTVELKDLGSRNGTLCNGEKISSRVLQDGDKIQIGNTVVLRFNYQDSLDESLHQTMFDLGTHDEVTQLHNRTFFEGILDKELKVAAAKGGTLALIMFELDGLEQLADQHGVAAADDVLRAVASRLRDLLRDHLVVARYGMRELVTLLKETPTLTGEQSAEKVRTAVAALQVQHNGVRLPFTVSAGVARSLPKLATSPDILVMAAAKALRAAKDTGRNRVVTPERLAELATKVTMRERRAHARAAIRISAQMLVAGQETELEARELSRGGVFLYCATPPAIVGSKMAIKLATTAGIRPIALEAQLVRVAHKPDGGVLGIGLRFVAPSVDQERALLGLIERGMQGAGTNNRAFPRVYSQLGVTIPSRSGASALLQDIGEGGACLWVDLRFSVNDELTIEIPITGDLPLRLGGFVVSSEPVADQAGTSRIGMRFARISAPQRTQLRALLASLCRK